MPTPTPPWSGRVKPAASMRTHLLLSALLWSAVGLGLAGIGTKWALEGGVFSGILFVAGAAVLGVLKARFAIDKAARRIVQRIEARGDGRCLGGFLSPGTWLFVLVMMVGGRILRSGLLPHYVVGPLYVLVGVALLVASRGPWRAWAGHRRFPHGPSAAG